MKEYLFKLYITGQSANSTQAIASLRRTLERRIAGRYVIELVDVVTQPQAAEDEGILATPTLVKERPGPPRRVIGSLSDSEKFLRWLDLSPVAEAADET